MQLGACKPAHTRGRQDSTAEEVPKGYLVRLKRQQKQRGKSPQHVCSQLFPRERSSVNVRKTPS